MSLSLLQTMREPEDFVENIARVRSEMGFEDGPECRDDAKRKFKFSDHPLARPLTDYEDRRESSHLKRRAEIGTHSAEGWQDVPNRIYGALMISGCGVSKCCCR